MKKGRLWSVDKSEFDPNDENQIVLSVLDKMAKNVGSQFYAKAHGLLKGMSEGLNHPIFVSLNAERLESSDMELLESIESAILSKNKLCVSYYKKEFVLSPVRIALFDGFWYLLAFDCYTNLVLRIEKMLYVSYILKTLLKYLKLLLLFVYQRRC